MVNIMYPLRSFMRNTPGIFFLHTAEHPKPVKTIIPSYMKAPVTGLYTGDMRRPLDGTHCMKDTATRRGALH